jgi:hypothetical protein
VGGPSTPQRHGLSTQAAVGETGCGKQRVTSLGAGRSGAFAGSRAKVLSKVGASEAERRESHTCLGDRAQGVCV